VERDGVLLKSLDHGGDGPPVLLLHGLAGHAREWDRTASWLSGGHRVLTLDQRGHGRSDRRPADVSRTAFVEDVVAVVEQLELGRVVLVGQSLGGHTALLTAARHPHLVTALVVVEAWPGGNPDTPEEIAAWLAGWPVPFRSRQAAVEFFTGEFGPAGDVASAWADGLEQRDGGWWPRFDNVTGLIQPTRKYERRRVFFAEIESGSLSSGATHGAGSGSARPPSDSARAGRWRRSRTTRSAKPSSLPPLWLGADRLIDANGKMNTARGLAEMAGPSIGGFIVGMVGAARAVTTDAASYLVSAATLTSMRFREPEPTPRGQETRFRTELAEGLGFVLRQPVLRALSLSGAITAFLLRGVGSLWLLYVIRDLHWSVRAAGLVYGLSLAGGVAGSVAAKSVVSRIGMGPAMILGALCRRPSNWSPRWSRPAWRVSGSWPWSSPH
jgi:pimeloyl-ACP methyl ester carboxylesterase